MKIGEIQKLQYMLHPFQSEQLLCWKLQPVGTLVKNLKIGSAGRRSRDGEKKRDGALSEANVTCDFDIV